MQIIKPIRMGLLARPWSWRGHHRLGVSVQLWCSMDEVALLGTEADMWRTLQPYLHEEEVMDLALPKPCAEFLVSGHAYSAHQADKTQVAAQVRVGALEKRLYVCGARRWQQGRASRPAAFERVALRPELAWGGPNDPENPYGIGAESRMEGGALPQIESWTHRLQRPADSVRVAGFGPVSPVRPRRFSLAGSYEPTWLKGDPRAFLDGMDPHFFNNADTDQWLRGHTQWPPDSEWEIANMHPEHAILQGRLPQWRTLCWFQPHGQQLQCLEMRHTTVWFFPDQEQMLLMYHGSIELDRPDESGIALLMPAVETAGQERGVAHYQAVLRNRSEGEFASLYALRDQDLLPSDHCYDLSGAHDQRVMAEDPAVQAVQTRVQRLVEKSVEQYPQMAQALAPLGKEPAQVDAKLDLSMLDELVRSGNRETWQARRTMENTLNELKQTSSEESARPDVPARPGARSRRSMQGLLGQWGAMDPSMAALGEQLSQKVPEWLRQSQAHSPEPGRLSSLRQQRLQRRVQLILSSSRNLSGLDLTGVDLRAYDLSHVRCVDTLFDGANLQEVSFVGADCRGASFVHARLLGAVFTEAELENSDFSHAVLQACKFQKMGCERSQFFNTILQDCEFEGVRFLENNWINCDVNQVHFLDCQFEQVYFMERSRLKQVSYQSCQFMQTTWLDCDMEQIDAQGSVFHESAWINGLFLSPPLFARTDWAQCCVVGLSLESADWTHAKLCEVNLRGLNLKESVFRNSHLLRCDFSEADLQAAHFETARASECLFMGTNLCDTVIRQVDFSNSLLTGADLTSARLDTVNLFRADLVEITTDARTRVRMLYLNGARQSHALESL